MWVRRIANVTPDGVPIGAVHVVAEIFVDVRKAGSPLTYLLDASWPYDYESTDFEILDPRLSRWFVASPWSDPMRPDVTVGVRICLPEFFLDHEMTYKLYDGDEAACELFETWLRKLELEFPDPTSDRVAIPLTEGWVQCPSCFDAWQPDPSYGRSDCPSCDSISNNSLWKNPGEE